MSKLSSPSANLDISRYDWVVDRISAYEIKIPSKVLFDIGPGDGRMRKLGEKGFSWHGFDITAWRDIQKWDLSEPCPISDLRAGAALLLDVIEHCTNPGLALQNIAAVTQEGGYLFLTTPNPSWSGSRLHELFRGTLASFTLADLQDNHHVLPIWRHVLDRLLAYAGFVVEEYVTLDGKTKLFNRPSKMAAPLRYSLNAVQILLERHDSNACGMTYGVVARKASSAAKMVYPGNAPHHD